MRAVVTGGAGFIGSNLVLALVERDDDVVVLDDLSTGFAENVHPSATFIEGSITDVATVERAVEAADLVFHLAAARAVLQSVEHPKENDDVNVGGTLNVLIAARDAGARRVVLASSSSVYGGAEEMPTPETATLRPKSPYAVSKLTTEHYARVFHELYGLETVALRFFNVFGPRQRPDSQYAAVIPLFIDALASDRPLEVHGDGLQSRDFTFIADVVRAMLHASEAPAEACAGQVFNVANGTAHTLIDLIEGLESAMGRRAQRNHVESRVGDIKDSCSDSSLAARALGWQGQVSFADGLARTVDWFKASST